MSGMAARNAPKNPFNPAIPRIFSGERGLCPKVRGDDLVQYVQVSGVERPREAIDDGLVFF
jgi:hypothetical protein